MPIPVVCAIKFSLRCTFAFIMWCAIRKPGTTAFQISRPRRPPYILQYAKRIGGSRTLNHLYQTRPYEIARSISLQAFIAAQSTGNNSPTRRANKTTSSIAEGEAAWKSELNEAQVEAVTKPLCSITRVVAGKSACHWEIRNLFQISHAFSLCQGPGSGKTR